MLTDVLQKIDATQAVSLEGLKDFLRIPSVSTKPEHKPDMQRCAQFVADHLTACGLTAKIIPTPGHPVVLAKSPHQPNRPTVLVYGHYDVQPPEPLDQWKTPAFDPTVRKDDNGYNAVFARGAVDDKGQVWCHIEALRAWHEASSGGTLPRKHHRAHRRRRRNWQHKPRRLHQKTRRRPQSQYRPRLRHQPVRQRRPRHHLWPARPGLRRSHPHRPKSRSPLRPRRRHRRQPRQSPLRVASHPEKHRRQRKHPRLLHRRPPRHSSRAKIWSNLPFDDETLRKETGVPELFGESGYSTLERKWARPTCDVNGLTSGYQGPGAKTIIPAKASAKVSMRLVPDQDPKTIEALFRKALESRCPKTVKIDIHIHSGAAPSLLAIDSKATQLAAKAVKTGFGIDPVFMREGGTIPVGVLFKAALGIDTIFVGFGLSDDRVHSPNEKFDLDALHKGTRTAAALYAELAKL